MLFDRQRAAKMDRSQRFVRVLDAETGENVSIEEPTAMKFPVGISHQLL